MLRAVIITLVAAIAFSSSAFATSTIDPTQPLLGTPYESTPIRNNFQAGANDINALQTCNFGTTAPSAPSSGYCWLNTSSAPIWTYNIYDGILGTWVPTGNLNSTTGVWSALGTPTGSSFSVATNAALKAMSTASIGAGTVGYRAGFAALGDGGAASYSFSTASCTLNLGAGDNGSQVAPTSGGGCWNAVLNGIVDDRIWGATCGSTDSTAAIQAAAAYLGSNGAGTVFIPCPQTIAGSVTLPSGVALLGNASMYYLGMLAGTWPATIGPAINCTSTTVARCIQPGGYGNRIAFVNLGNPQPAPPASGTYAPTFFPPIIGTVPATNWAGLLIDDDTFTAASQCIDLEGSPSYVTTGVAGSQATLRNLYMNPCLNQGIILHDLDNTIEIDNVEYDFWWNRGNPTVGAYVKNNSVGMTWKYAANTRLNGIEFFSNKIAIDQINDSVVYSGSLIKTFAAVNIQGTNISFNEVCQAMGNESGTSLISTGMFKNVILYQDTSDAPVNCPLNSNAAIDLSSSGGANWTMDPLRVGDVQTVADIGANSTLKLDGVDILGYSYFNAGAPAFKVSSGADFSLGSSLAAAIRPASGTCVYGQPGVSQNCGTAGNLMGPGFDSTQGYMQPLCVGGGTKALEGAACIGGSGSGNNSGALFLYDLSGTEQGFVGAASSAGLNVNSTNGSVFLNSKSGTHSATAAFSTNTSSQNIVNFTPLPTAPPSGTGGVYVCVDSQGNLYVKSSCP